MTLYQKKTNKTELRIDSVPGLSSNNSYKIAKVYLRKRNVFWAHYTWKYIEHFHKLEISSLQHTYS